MKNPGICRMFDTLERERLKWPVRLLCPLSALLGAIARTQNEAGDAAFTINCSAMLLFLAPLVVNTVLLVEHPGDALPFRLTLPVSDNKLFFCRYGYSLWLTAALLLCFGIPVLAWRASWLMALTYCAFCFLVPLPIHTVTFAGAMIRPRGAIWGMLWLLPWAAAWLPLVQLSRTAMPFLIVAGSVWLLLESRRIHCRFLPFGRPYRKELLRFALLFLFTPILLAVAIQAVALGVEAYLYRQCRSFPEFYPEDRPYAVTCPAWFLEYRHIPVDSPAAPATLCRDLARRGTDGPRHEIRCRYGSEYERIRLLKNSWRIIDYFREQLAERNWQAAAEAQQALAVLADAVRPDTFQSLNYRLSLLDRELLILIEAPADPHLLSLLNHLAARLEALPEQLPDYPIFSGHRVSGTRPRFNWNLWSRSISALLERSFRKYSDIRREHQEYRAGHHPKTLAEIAAYLETSPHSQHVFPLRSLFQLKTIGLAAVRLKCDRIIHGRFPAKFKIPYVSCRTDSNGVTLESHLTYPGSPLYRIHIHSEGGQP